MDKLEYEKSKANIIKQFGQPEYDMSDPVNESAKKLVELKNLYLKGLNDAVKAEKLEKNIKEIVKALPGLSRPVPQEVVRAEYLVAFTEKQKEVVHQWFKNVGQSIEAIAVATGNTETFVKNTMSLEAFKALRLNLTKGLLEVTNLEAIIALRECLNSKQDNIKFNAAELFLRDQGILKDKQPDTVIKNEVVLDKDKMDELNAQANKLLGYDNA
jgi:hypothetical protein